MSRTHRRLKGEQPRWLENYAEYSYNGDVAKAMSHYYSDSFDGSSDACPPKWFRQQEQRKFRHKVDQQIRQGIEDIETDYKMPYYT